MEANMKLTKDILDQVRKIKGFPLGKDEDIINLSETPSYTACPNPFINDFLDMNGKDCDENNDLYDIKPYTLDVSEGKSDSVYMAYTYHTKVPYKAIMKYILHYTKPDDVVFDGFCGSGMTGVAALMCEKPDERLKVEMESQLEGESFSWGKRFAVLNDISTAATFISKNSNSKVNPKELEKELKIIKSEVENECSWMYETKHTVGGIEQTDISGNVIKGKISYSVWSDIFVCHNCNKEIVYWDAGIDERSKKTLEEFYCPHCNAKVNKKSLERATESVFDAAINQVIEKTKRVPVMISYNVGNKRYEKKPDESDLNLLTKIENIDIPYWFPTEKMLFKGAKWGETWRAGYHLGITNVHHFFTKRNLYVLSAFFNKSSKSKYKSIIILATLSSLARTSIRNRYMPQYGNRHVGTLSGTLYVPTLIEEDNALTSVSNRMESLKDSYSSYPTTQIEDSCIISTSSMTECSNIKSNSVDYIFTDPPFGDNLLYSELNFIWEAWLKVFTNNSDEAIINRSQKKELFEYKELMEKSFSEMYRILKPGRWMTVEFHNSKNTVWNAIQEAILKAGFVIADVRTLDKKKGTTKQLTYSMTVMQDLVISAYKPKDSFVKEFLIEAGTEEGVWHFIREHLRKLPPYVEKDGVLEIISERQNYLLYDRMVAYHIQKGVSIPMGAADFYIGLKQRFPERDNMFFLPDQVSIYDAKRVTQELYEQLSLLVLDEKTAIQWIRNEIKIPQTYQEIQPKFIKELHQLKYEKMPELRDLLEENFLQDETGKWYVPDVNKQSDLEKLREKKLLKEFDDYREGKGKLKIFRMEAIRSGFKYCWKEKDYKTIVNIGERMPEAVVQEDPSILMYYDNALTRIGD